MSMGIGGTYIASSSQIASGAIPMVKVSESTVSGSAVTSVSFTSLDLDTAKQYMIVMSIKAAASCLVYMEFNTDTTLTNYYNQYTQGASTTIAGARANTPRVGYIVNATGSYIVSYVNRSYGGLARVTGLSNNNQSASIANESFYMNWTTANNVTQIDIVAASANAFDVGSKFTVFAIG